MINQNSSSFDWTGTVEDRLDPQGLGRLRVRIHQYHSFDKSELPTSALPWSLVSFPVNSSRMVSAPKVGEMVHGKFIDGENARVPLVMGVIPGINTVMPTEETGAPVMPVGEIIITAGRPSTPPLSRGEVENTAVGKANKKLEHVCDISTEVDQAVGALKTFFGTVGRAIREAINYVLDALGLGDPSGQFKTLTSLAKDINRKIKEVNKYLKDINKTIVGYLKIVRKVQAMIAYIQSLPAKYLALFKQCLARLYSIIAAGMKSLFPDFGVGSDIAELRDAIKETQATLTETVRETISIATTPAKLAGVLTIPTSAAEAEAAAADFKTYVYGEEGLTTLIQTSDIKNTADATTTSVLNTINPLNDIQFA